MRNTRSAAGAMVFALLGLSNAAWAEPAPAGPASGQRVPRYVSLRADTANGRHGPGEEHRIDWIYQRSGLPLQVTAESGPWRRVVDPDGATVWMHERNLENRRTVYFRSDAVMRRTARPGAAPAAYPAAGVIAALTGCEGHWRRVAIGGRVGWVEAEAVWGGEDCSGI